MSTTYLVSQREICGARTRCTARGLPAPGSIRIAKALQFWERECPGRGRTIVTMLEPFYACCAWFPLAPPTEDLDARARDAIFWRDVAGAATVTRLKPAVEAMGNSPDVRPTDVLASLSGALALEVAERLHNALGNYLWQTLPKHLWEELGSSIWVGIEDHFGGDDRDHAFDWVWGALARTLFVAIGCVLADEPDTTSGLLDMWLAGNWPLGFSDDGALLVMCAGP